MLKIKVYCNTKYLNLRGLSEYIKDIATQACLKTLNSDMYTDSFFASILTESLIIMNEYQLAVIGGGPGGYVAAICGAKLGLKTVLIEKEKMGGTCLNCGCIPTKSLLQSAHTFHAVKNCKKLGIQASDVSYDYAAIAKRKDSMVRRLRGGVEGLLKAAGVEVVFAEATLEADNTIVAGDRHIQASSIIVATGAEPNILPISGADLPNVLCSTKTLELTEAPKSVIIIGGGVIGMEFASFYNDLQIPVTILEFMPTVLTGLDADVVNLMTKRFKKNGVVIHTNAKVTGIEDGEQKTVAYELDGKLEKVSADIVIMATGRKPVTAGLENSGLDIQKQSITVDDQMRTNVPNVYAIGDCTGKIQLAHVASAQGIVAAHNAAGKLKHMRYDIVPACVYTSPEIACVGLTEQEARNQGDDIKIGSFPVAANGKSMILGESDGFCKLITHAKTGKILGCHMVAPTATDMIGEIVATMQAEGTVEDLASAIHPHPTVNEIIMEAAHDVEGLCIHKM